MTKTWLSEQLLIFAGITTEVPDIPKTVDISLGKSFDILVQIQKMSPSQFFCCLTVCITKLLTMEKGECN